MTRTELDQLLEAAKHHSDNVEIAAAEIAEALNLFGESDLTAQEMKEAAIKLVWTATGTVKLKI